VADKRHVREFLLVEQFRTAGRGRAFISGAQVAWLSRKPWMNTNA
jgi:hypothetical protein